MSDAIQVGDKVSWLHAYLYGAKRVRQGKVVTLTGSYAYVKTRRDSKPMLVALALLNKVESNVKA